MPTFTTPPTTDPPLSLQPDVVFDFGPFTVTLPAPNFGNTERLNFSRVQRETRRGTTEIFYDPQWPIEDVLVLPFNTLNQTQHDNLIVFLDASIGHIVQYRDHENMTWEGVITTVNAEFKSVSKASPCSEEYYSVTLEFLGTLQWP